MAVRVRYTRSPEDVKTLAYEAYLLQQKFVEENVLLSVSTGTT